MDCDGLTDCHLQQSLFKFQPTVQDIVFQSYSYYLQFIFAVLFRVNVWLTLSTLLLNPSTRTCGYRRALCSRSLFFSSSHTSRKALPQAVYGGLATQASDSFFLYSFRVNNQREAFADHLDQLILKPLFAVTSIELQLHLGARQQQPQDSKPPKNQFQLGVTTGLLLEVQFSADKKPIKKSYQQQVIRVKVLIVLFTKQFEVNKLQPFNNVVVHCTPLVPRRQQVKLLSSGLD